MRNLLIQTVENGFTASENNQGSQYTQGKMWVFETSESLAKFVAEWGMMEETKND
jgi:hypothetical protein